MRCQHLRWSGCDAIKNLISSLCVCVCKKFVRVCDSVCGGSLRVFVRERETQCVCVCACVCEKERKRMCVFFCSCSICAELQRPRASLRRQGPHMRGRLKGEERDDEEEGGMERDGWGKQEEVDVMRIWHEETSDVGSLSIFCCRLV